MLRQACRQPRRWPQSAQAVRMRRGSPDSGTGCAGRDLSCDDQAIIHTYAGLMTAVVEILRVDESLAFIVGVFLSRLCSRAANPAQSFSGRQKQK